MKKLFFVAVAACAMMFASCGKSMSPEAAKAWQDVKDKSTNLLTVDDVDKFESTEAYNAACQAFNNAVQEMTKYDGQYPKEVVDSFAKISTQFGETAKKVAELLQAEKEMDEASAAVDEADAEAEGATEEEATTEE